MSGPLSWINPLWKIATGLCDMIHDEQARDRIYFNEVYRDHIVQTTERLRTAGKPYKHLSLDDFVEEFNKTNIRNEIALSVCSDNSTLQQAVRNVCSHHQDAYERVAKHNDMKTLIKYVYKWYVEHLYNDYKQREWEGIGFHAWKAIRG